MSIFGGGTNNPEFYSLTVRYTKQDLLLDLVWGLITPSRPHKLRNTGFIVKSAATTSLYVPDLIIYRQIPLSSSHHLYYIRVVINTELKELFDDKTNCHFGVEVWVRSTMVYRGDSLSLTNLDGNDNNRDYSWRTAIGKSYRYFLLPPSLFFQNKGSHHGMEYKNRTNSRSVGA